MSLRQLLLGLALVLFVLAAICSYSPRLGRHAPALGYAGLAAFTLALLARGTVTDGD